MKTKDLRKYEKKSENSNLTLSLISILVWKLWLRKLILLEKNFSTPYTTLPPLKKKKLWMLSITRWLINPFETQNCSIWLLSQKRTVWVFVIYNFSYKCSKLNLNGVNKGFEIIQIQKMDTILNSVKCSFDILSIPILSARFGWLGGYLACLEKSANHNFLNKRKNRENNHLYDFNKLLIINMAKDQLRKPLKMCILATALLLAVWQRSWSN